MSTAELKKVMRIFSKGDTVRVKNNINKTEGTFTTNRTMESLMGEEIKVTNIDWSSKHECPCVHAGGWAWHSDDLFVVNHINPGKLIVDGQIGSFMFDPKTL